MKPIILNKDDIKNHETDVFAFFVLVCCLEHIKIVLHKINLKVLSYTN